MIFQTGQDIEKFSQFSPSDYESRFVSRTLQQVESEIIAYESSGFESQNFETSLELPSSDSSDDWSSDSDVDSDDSTDDFAWFTERPISPPKATLGASDSFVEDPYCDKFSSRYGISKPAPQKTYFTSDDWSALKLQTREGTCNRKDFHTFQFEFLSHKKVSIKSNDRHESTSSKAKFGPWSVTDSSSEQKSTKSLADIAGDWMERLHK